MFAQAPIPGNITGPSGGGASGAASITSGTIDGTTIGATTPSTGGFSSVVTSGSPGVAGHVTDTLICTQGSSNCYVQILLQPAGASWQISSAGSGATTLPGGIYVFDGTNVRMAWEAAGSFGFGIGNSTTSASADPFFVNGSTGAMTTTTVNTKGNCFTGASPAACGASPSGFVVVAAAASTVLVNTTSVTAHSEIHLTFDSSIGSTLSMTCNTTPVQPTVSARVASTSFTITVPVSPITNPACFTYNIIN